MIFTLKYPGIKLPNFQITNITSSFREKPTSKLTVNSFESLKLFM